MLAAGTNAAGRSGSSPTMEWTFMGTLLPSGTRSAS